MVDPTKTDASSSPLLTVDEVARLLRRSRNGTYEDLKRLPLSAAVIKLGRSIRVSRYTLLRLLGAPDP
ncbi:MAG: helix-turn-helix domain-containing protein [Candidatus Eremiobacteraeota bacterium]|nr:helix-turn-helix domain-containing protein [Candidatus Eremiobacteraeota bacterium]